MTNISQKNRPTERHFLLSTLEIELWIILAIMLLLGILFGYSFASPSDEILHSQIPQNELMRSSFGDINDLE